MLGRNGPSRTNWAASASLEVITKPDGEGRDERPQARGLRVLPTVCRLPRSARTWPPLRWNAAIQLPGRPWARSMDKAPAKVEGWLGDAPKRTSIWWPSNSLSAPECRSARPSDAAPRSCSGTRPARRDGTSPSALPCAGPRLTAKVPRQGAARTGVQSPQRRSVCVCGQLERGSWPRLC